MNWLDWVRGLFGRPKPPPPPKPKPPAPAPGFDLDEWRRRGLVALNARRAARGAGPVAFDSGLNAAAMALAPGLGAGTMAPHQDMEARIRPRGWPYEDRHLARASGFGNIGEGCGFGGRTPEECVLNLDNSSIPTEAHRVDFEDRAWTHVGMAFAVNARGPYAAYGGYAFVLDYGAR